MVDYGDRVQFSLVSGGPEPSYQIANTLGKKMAFDKNHHLLQSAEEDFAGANASMTLTIDQVKTRIAAAGTATPAKARATKVARAGSSGPRVTAAKLNEQYAAQRYEYFKNNRQSLPPTISEHTDEITELMKQGKSAQEAFDEVVSKYF